MSEKRRDNKGRVLRTGEGQRSNGQYYYKYTDENKKTKFIYNWRLENHDKVPQGKRKKSTYFKRRGETDSTGTAG